MTQGTTVESGNAAVPADRDASLERGAVRLLDGTVIGVASAAPAYSLTATAALLASNLVFAGIFPLFGGLAFFYICYKAAQGLTVEEFWTGVGLMLLGLPLLAWSYFHNRPFYHQPTESAEPDDLVTAQPAPSSA